MMQFINTRICLLSFALAWGAAFAQTPTGEARGGVADEGGADLPGATVSLSLVSGPGSGRTALTNEKGEWTIRGLAPGEYRMTVGLEGFATSVRQITVRALQTTGVEILLRLAEITEELIVTAEAPLVLGVQNSASNRAAFAPQGGVASGSTVNVFGVRFTDSPLVQPTELPLQDNLGGASFWVEMDGQTYPTYPVFLTPNQAGVILDSDTPPGRGEFLGEIDGFPTNRLAVDIVSLAPGIYTVPQDGTGQSIVTRTDFSLVTRDRPLIPNELFIAWGNGWGPSQVDTTGGLFDKRDQYDDLKLYFGDTAVDDDDVLYVGTAGGFAGGDQVIGRVPLNAPLGCGAPFFGVITPVGSQTPVLSNVVTVPISEDGGPCGDQTGLSPQQIRQISPNGELDVVDLTLDEFRLIRDGEPALFFLGSVSGSTLNAASYDPPIPHGSCVINWRPDNFQNPRAPTPLEFNAGLTVTLPWTQFEIGPGSNLGPFAQGFSLQDPNVIMPGTLSFTTPPDFTVNGVPGQLMGDDPYNRTAGRINEELAASLFADDFIRIDDAIQAAITARQAAPPPADDPIGFGYRATLDAGPRGTTTLECREDLADLTPQARVIELAREMLCAAAPKRIESGSVDVFLFPADTVLDGPFPNVDLFRVHTDASNRYLLNLATPITDTAAFATCP